MDASGLLICWGCGEHGQHCHGRGVGDVASRQGLVKNFGSHAASSSRIVFVACGSSHTVALTESNEIYAWGNGSCGQLGTEDCDVRWQPTRVDPFRNCEGLLTNQKVAGVCCGGRQTIVWLQNGQACSFGFGQRTEDELQIAGSRAAFNGQKQVLYRPCRLIDIPKVSSIACGEDHAIFLFAEGLVGANGSNSFGQLGTGDRAGSSTLRIIDGIMDILSVACGSHHSLALAESGMLLVWGYGKAIGYEDGDILTPTERVHHNTNIVMLAGGRNHSIALTENGNVYTWGNGTEGQLGHGSSLTFSAAPRKIEHPGLQSRVVQVAAGDLYSAAITNNGSLFMWGKDSHVIVENGDPAGRIYYPRLVNTALHPVRFIACGAWHAACITSCSDRAATDLPVSLEEDCRTQAEAERVMLSDSSSSHGLPSLDIAFTGPWLPALDVQDNPPQTDSGTRGSFSPSLDRGTNAGAVIALADDSKSNFVGTPTVAHSSAGGSGLCIADGNSETAVDYAQDTTSHTNLDTSAQPFALHFTQHADGAMSRNTLTGGGSHKSGGDEVTATFNKHGKECSVPSGDILSAGAAVISYGESLTATAQPAQLQTKNAKPTFGTSSVTKLFPQRSDTTVGTPSQMKADSITLPGLFKRAATKLPEKLPETTATKLPEMLGAPELLLLHTDYSSVDNHMPSNKTIGFVPRQSLFANTSSDVTQLHRRETAEERLVREMKNRHAELFMKEKALRRQLLPGGAARLAKASNMVASKARHLRHIGHEHMPEHVPPDNHATLADGITSSSSSSKKILMSSLLGLAKSSGSIPASLKNAKVPPDGTFLTNVNAAVVTQPGNTLPSWTVARHYSFPCLPRNS